MSAKNFMKQDRHIFADRRYKSESGGNPLSVTRGTLRLTPTGMICISLLCGCLAFWIFVATHIFH